MTTHKREVWPFLRALRTFETTALRIDAESDYDSGESVFICHETDAEVPEALNLQIRFDVDAHEVAQATNLPTSRIDVVVVLEQKSVRVARVLERWPIEDIPRYWEHTLRPEQTTERIEIRLAAVLNNQRGSTNSEAAWREGSLLSDRTFVIRRPVSESLFPVHNTSFAKREWDQQALWYVEYDSPEDAHQLKPSDVFSVHLNSDLDALNHLWLKSTPRRGSIPRVMANMVRKTIVAGIIGDVSIATLGRFQRLREEYPDVNPEPESTVDLLLKFLKEKVGKPTDDILEMAAADEGKLRAAIQDIVGCGKAFGSEPLTVIRDVE